MVWSNTVIMELNIEETLAEEDKYLWPTFTNVLNINFWTAPWTKFGQLLTFIGPEGPRQTCIPLSSVADLWRNVALSLPHAQSPAMEELLISTPVPWYMIIWLKTDIPKHKSLAWLMLLNKFPTRDRLLFWGLQTDPLCILCNNDNESRNHIYFICPISTTVWSYFANLFQIPLLLFPWMMLLTLFCRNQDNQTLSTSPSSRGRQRSFSFGLRETIYCIGVTIKLWISSSHGYKASSKTSSLPSDQKTTNYQLWTSLVTDPSLISTKVSIH
ncbi:hypothetical protein N665_0895s0002 [Sinapis alba]|nr:hypothetical protein N665_0895s0002 [Sinapis alba]